MADMEVLNPVDSRAQKNQTSSFTEPDEDLCGKITNLVEFYFSDENITKDEFLLKLVKNNEEGFVKIEIISNCKAVKQLTKDWRQVAFALRKCSKKLEINNQGTKVRRKNKIPPNDVTAPSRTVVAINIPYPHNATVKGVKSVFSSSGKVVWVRILASKSKVSDGIRQCLKKHKDIENKVLTLVEYELSESAEKAVKGLNNSGMQVFGLNHVNHETYYRIFTSLDRNVEHKIKNKRGKWQNFKSNWKQILYLILFGLSVSCFDFLTDCLTGGELFNENHVVWGSLTFFLMWIPGLMVGIQRLWAFCSFKKKKRKIVRIADENPLNALPQFEEGESFDDTDNDEHVSIGELKEKKITYYRLWKEYPLTVVLCVFFFPVGVLSAQFWHIYALVTDDEDMIKQFEFVTTRMRGFEAFFESGPQLTLQMFIDFYTGSWTETQLASICFSLFTLSSTAVFSDMLFAKLKDVKTTLAYLASVLPLYFSSVVFKVGSLTFTIIYLRYYAIIPIVLSFGLKCLVARKLKFGFRDSVEMAFCNMSVVYVGPSEPKGRSSDGARFMFMMFSTLISIVIYDIILVILAILFNMNPTCFQFWKDILINPAHPESISLHTLNFIIGILILMSFVNLSLFVATKYTNLTQTGAQILSDVGNTISKIDDLDNPEVKSEEVFKEIQNLTLLLDKPYITEFKSVEVIAQIENLCQLLNSDKCLGVNKTSEHILEASNNLIRVIDEKKPGVSTANILHKTSVLTRLLPNSEDLDFGTGKKIIDGIRSLRMLLKNPNIEITTSQLLSEIKGITDVLNRSDLEMATSRDERTVLGSIKNLRNKLPNFDTTQSEQNHSEEILEEINVLICKMDLGNVKYKFDENTKKFITEKAML